MRLAAVAVLVAASSACSQKVYSPPAQTFSVTPIHVLAPGQSAVDAEVSTHSEIFDPAINAFDARYRAGVGANSEVTVEGTAHAVDDQGPSVADRTFYSGRVGVRMTGSLPPNQPKACNGPSAGLWIHDTLDKSNLLETNVAALNLALKTNGCEGDYENGPKRPWAPAEDIPGLQGVCQEYTGCSPEMSKNYPLIFCTTTGFGHADQPSVIPAATTFFDLMNPAP